MHSRRHWLRRLLKVLYHLLFALVLALIALYLWDNRASLRAVWNVPAYLWLIPVALYVVTLTMKGVSFDILARVHGVHVPLLDSLGLTASGLLSNYALPGNAAIPLRTLYMHRVLGLHYKDFLTIALAAFVFSTGLYGVMAGVAGLTQGAHSSTYFLVMLVLGGGGLALIIALLLPYSWLPLFGPRIERVLDGWRQLHRSWRLFGQWLSVELVRAAFEVAFFYSIVSLLSIELTLLQTAILVLAKECSVFLRITPGALGVAEGVQIFFAAQFGVEPPTILMAAIIGRAIELLCLLLVSFLLTKRLALKISGRRGLHAAPDLQRADADKALQTSAPHQRH